MLKIWCCWLIILPFFSLLNFAPATLVHENTFLQVNSQNHLNTSVTNEGYQNLILDGVSETNFFGRVLKFYYANNIIVPDQDITNLKTILTSIEYSDAEQNLIIQNLMASTINISIYGSSNDAEFFAEAFAKWLQTPDEQKNISWEITNDFFMNVLPLLLTKPLNINDANDISTITQLVIFESYNDDIEYLTNVKPTNDNTVPLKYINNIFSMYWTSSSHQTIKNILKHIKSPMPYLTDQNYINIANIAKTWTNYSFQRASQASIDRFKQIIEPQNHFTSFEVLDQILYNSSIDRDGESRIHLNDTFNALANTYEDKLPTGFTDTEIWNDEKTIYLKQSVLFLYNVMYFLIGNEEYVKNLVIGFIVASDYPLIASDGSNMSNVLGYTSTEISYDTTKSTVSSYIVLTGLSLVYKDFNYNYTSGFWSAPNKFAVIFHEYGHALDYFGTKNDKSRASRQIDTLYSSMYKGNIFGDTYVYNFFSRNMTFIISAVLVILAIIIFITLLIIVEKKHKPVHKKK